MIDDATLAAWEQQIKAAEDYENDWHSGFVSSEKWEDIGRLLPAAIAEIRRLREPVTIGGQGRA